jgi:hypothetical protein
MAIWPSLAPRAAAARACKWGGLAALLQAVRGTAGNIATFMTVDKPLDDAIAHFVGASLFASSACGGRHSAVATR